MITRTKHHFIFSQEEEEEEVLMIHFITFPTESKTEFQYSLPIHFLLKELRNPFRKMKTKKSSKIDLLLELSGLELFLEQFKS